METTGNDQSIIEEGHKTRKHHSGGHHHHTRKMGSRLRRYLLVLNVLLAWYGCYTIFFLIMQRYCHSDQKCFLDTNLNHLLLMLAVFSFATHMAVSLIAFIKHRRNKSRRLMAHQIIALVTSIVTLLLFLFKGLALISEVLAGVAY